MFEIKLRYIEKRWSHEQLYVWHSHHDVGPWFVAGAFDDKSSNLQGKHQHLLLTFFFLVITLFIHQDRMLSVNQLLRTYLSSDCQFIAPTGGYFIWICFPETIDVNEFNAFACTHYRVSAIAGNDFSAENKFKNCIRISIAFFGGEKLCSAIKTLCRAYEDFSSQLRGNELKQ